MKIFYGNGEVRLEGAVNIGAFEIRYKGKIYADTNVERRTRRGIQVAVLTDPQYAIKWIEDWAEKNHLMSPPEKPPFEEQIREVIRREIKHLNGN